MQTMKTVRIQFEVSPALHRHIQAHLKRTGRTLSRFLLRALKSHLNDFLIIGSSASENDIIVGCIKKYLKDAKRA